MVLHGLAAGLRRLAGAALVALVAACGGGGGDGGTPPGGGGIAAPQITTQPQAASVDDGATASFSVTASGTTLAYQWQRNGADIAGATSASFALAPATLADDGASFRVVVSNGGGSVTSNAAALTVRALAPVITTPPAAASVAAGQSATFSVVASGSAPLSYQWRRNGADIAGATASSYTIAAVGAGDDGAQISVLVSNAAGSATSAPVALTVNGLPAFGGQRIAVGNGYALAVRADGRVITWGTAQLAQIGAPLAGTAARDTGISARTVAPGTFESLALRADGVVVGWGQRGPRSMIGGETDFAGETITTPIPTAFGAGIQQVAVAQQLVAFALHSDGTVWSLPGVTTAPSIGRYLGAPRQVSGLSGVVSLGVGGVTGHGVAVTADGGVWTLNVTLGVFDATASASQVGGLPAIRQASCSPLHCLALATDGSVWAWGNNASGQLGVGDTTSRTVPLRIDGLTDVAFVAAGQVSSHAITRNGQLWNWGAASLSGLASPGGDLLRPTQLPGFDDVREVSADNFVLVRRADGSVWGWGTNIQGELGTGTTGDSPTPVRTLGINLN